MSEPTVLYVEEVKVPVTAETIGVELAAGFPRDVAAVLRAFVDYMDGWLAEDIEGRFRAFASEFTREELFNVERIANMMLAAIQTEIAESDHARQSVHGQANGD